ncbi:MAG: DUF6088 family protein [Prosthecobacter sp.]|uniref:DUF6088 family protein n=1 Tax=Prosthecobacter sp. TaxID=1965333 RepID=UPI0038FF115C
MKSLENEILKRLRGRGRGTAACPADFLNLGSRAAVDQVLSRLVKKGTLERVDRGVYALPKISPVLGRLSPEPEAVAQALARRGAQRLIPAGAHAANLLGLTTQVPARIEYLTDGPPCRAMIQKLPIILKRTTTLACGSVMEKVTVPSELVRTSGSMDNLCAISNWEYSYNFSD